MPRRLLSTAVVSCLLVAASAYSQGEPAQDLGAPAHVAVVQGNAVLERNGVGEAVAENLPLLQGDRLRTETGRLEIILPDSSVLDLDRGTTVDLLAGGLIRLMGGRMIFVLSSPLDAEPRRDYQVDAPAGSVRFTHAGEYRIFTNVSPGVPFLEVGVVRGRAVVVDADGRSMPLSAGERAQATQGQGVTATGTFNSALADPFVEWAEGLRGQRVGVQSSAYLPPELQAYGGTFDRDGRWSSSGEYGAVWYPNVSDDWRPYYDGEWYPYGWGWTWVGAGRWTWPTHHYGRWGHGTRGWFWIPGAQWGPAWVSWGFSAGYVSWCPLTYHDEPVFGLSFGMSLGGYGSPWLGWTVVPHRAFGHGYRVPGHALRGDHLKEVEHVGFDVGRQGPAIPGGPAGTRGGVPRATPYDRAQGAQRVSDNPGWGRATTGPRPSVTDRRWSTDAASPYGRAQGVAAQRSAGLGGTERPTAGARENPTRSFSSSRTLPLYPNGYRTTDAPSQQGLGSAVPRSAPARPSESRSPYYYLGPSKVSPAPVPPRQASPPAGRPGGPGGAPEPSASPDPRTYSSPASTWPSPPESYGSPGSTAVPRGYREPGSASSPYPADYGSPGWSSTRSYSTPDRAAAPRPAPATTGSSAGSGERSSGDRPSTGAPPSSGFTGGRTPSHSPAAGAGPGGGARGGGARGGATGGGGARGGGARGGRGR